MKQYFKALPYLLEATEIAEQNLPPDHTDLVTAYDNIGFVYDKIGNQSEALMYFEKSLNIRLKVLPSDDSSLIDSYSNQIAENILPPDQSVLANLYNHICIVYINSRDNSKAFSYFKKVHEIHQKIDPSNHPTADAKELFLEFLKRRQ